VGSSRWPRRFGHPVDSHGGLALLVGVDRFMSEARSITNLIGNAVATVVIAAWDGALDRERATTILRTGRVPDALAVADGVLPEVTQATVD
jgi:aerobic C4-dicarboxylate transport protein